MSLARCLVLASLVFSFGASVVRANTYVVGVSPAPGIDFTTIQTAIDAASPNDTILVRPGQHTAFNLTKPLRILGQGPGFLLVNGQSTVSNIGSGQTAVIAGLRFNLLNFPSLTISNCAGAFMGDDLDVIGGLRVVGSSDVRLRNFSSASLQTALLVEASRVELSVSALFGSLGSNLTCAQVGTAGPGRTPVVVTSGEIHLARTTLYGGWGGNATCGDPGLCGADGGPGGYGLFLGPGASALVTGISTDVIVGGSGGISDCGLTGATVAGVYLSAGANLRYSGVTITGIDNQGGAVLSPPALDPSVVMLETPHPGSNLTLRVTGTPGSQVSVRFGREPQLVLVPGLEEDFLTTSLRTINLPLIPASGTIGMNVSLPANYPKGVFFVAQAFETRLDTSVARTNSIPIVLR